ncbi:hypothetical protein [Sorangium sp. So ce128]|uniref:hypothetical protein n=1 Tax=Sorangium sp. So ce128 TaxID=3133281 RepID=UPI003F5F0240
MVDDQYETYDVELLHTLKSNHERWVSSKLTEERETPPVRIRRIKKNIPSHLVRLMTGKDIINLVYGAAAFSFQLDEFQSQEETDLVAGFLQDAQDWGEILPELEAGERVRAAFRMTTQLRELETAGFFVFGSQEVQQLEGGIGPPTPFIVAILHIMRSTNPTIMKITVPPDSSETPASAKITTEDGSNV